MDRLKEVLAKKFAASKSKDNVSYVVGYSSDYAVHVHENLKMALKGKPRPSGLGNYWDGSKGPGRSKFLEHPARASAKDLGSIIRTVYEKTGNIEDGVKIAALRLQRESMELVPVEYGHLRASAFVAKEE